MKSLALAAALLIGSAAYAQSGDMPAPASTDNSVGLGANAPSAGADAAAQPNPTPAPAPTADASGGAMPMQTADSGPVPRCSRKVTDHCIEKR